MTDKPYALCSDVHCHSWSAFATTNSDGVNSRLQIILDELMACATELRSRGGDKMIIAGDLFHVRGSVKPSVMNPVMDTFGKIERMGVFVEAIAGNHDLEGKDASQIGNAMQALGALRGFNPITKPSFTKAVQDGGYTGNAKIFMFPWYSELDALREKMNLAIEKIEGSGIDPKEFDAVIHAPLNGVLKGLPDTGFDPAELSSIGFNRVFVGHFHNHKSFEGGKVYSVGATTHQTWNDPGSRAGYCMVYPDRVDFIPSSAPSFVDIKSAEDVDETTVSGNYVRLKLEDVTEAEIKTFRDELESLGAKGVNIIATKKTEATREASISSGASLEVSVAEYIEKDAEFSDKDALQKVAAEILLEARSR